METGFQVLNYLGRLFSWTKRTPKRSSSPLDRTLLDLSPKDPWTTRDAVAGTLILGETGSGKTSGSGREVAYSFLNSGMGGLVLAAKGDEADTWAEYCHHAGRSDDLRIVRSDAMHRMNFLDEELRASTALPGGATLNIVALLLNALEVCSRIGSGGGGGGGGSGGGGGDGDAFWRNSSRSLITNCVDLLLMAKGKVTVLDIHRVITSAPQSSAQSLDPAWQAESFCFQSLKQASRATLTPERSEDLEIVGSYFLREFPELAGRTRSIVVSSVSAMTDPLLRGLCRTLFCTDTTITPSLTGQGKVIVVALPVKTLREVGLLGTILWKLAFQRYAERRDIRTDPRPVFLWADEGHLSLTSNDHSFQSTCRSSRVATVLLSQNVSNFYAALGGGERGKAEADSLLGHFATRIFHANTEPVTNRWASDLIGSRLKLLMNGGSSRPESTWGSAAMGLQESGNASAGFSESMLPEVDPSEFVSLRSGGPANKRCVDAIVVKSGTGFRATGRNWMRCTFQQAQNELSR